VEIRTKIGRDIEEIFACRPRWQANARPAGASSRQARGAANADRGLPTIDAPATNPPPPQYDSFTQLDAAKNTPARSNEPGNNNDE